MKRTVEISTRYQPVIDFYKGYNNAEFNVLSSNLLCQYQLFLKQKNVDLLPLLECLKSYDFELTDLLVVLAQNFEKLSKEQIRDLNDSIVSEETVDNTGVKQTRKKRKPVEKVVEKETKKVVVEEFDIEPEFETVSSNYNNFNNSKPVEPVVENTYNPERQYQQEKYEERYSEPVRQVEVERQPSYGNPYHQPTHRDGYVNENPYQQERYPEDRVSTYNSYSNYNTQPSRVQQEYYEPEPQYAPPPPPPPKPVQTEPKKNNRPAPRRFTLAEMGLDLSD